jgi:23S rRNA pseudouridine1911/1915/1917 synthase
VDYPPGVDAAKLLAPDEEFEFHVGAAEAGERLDRLVARRARWASRSAAARWIRAGRASVDGAVDLRPARPLAPGALVRVRAEKTRRDLDAPLDDLLAAIAIVHRGGDWLVARKPGGVPCHPGGGVIKRTLLTALGLALSEVCEGGGPWLPHRLDRETSGLQVVALTREAARRFATAFAAGGIRRLYTARVRGRVSAPAGEWVDLRFALREASHRPKRIAVDPAGVPAHTRLLLLAAGDAASAVRLEAVTGRQHQLRVHCAHLGHPVAGDPIYDPAAHRGERMELSADELRIPAEVARSAAPLVVRSNCGR